jgi:hypothetical protein
MTTLKQVFLQCTCNIPEHVVKVTLDTTEEPAELTIQPFLNPNLSFLTRIYVAIKYVLGIKSPSDTGSYQFDCVLLTVKQVDELSALIVHMRLLDKFRKIAEAKKSRDSITPK